MSAPAGLPNRPLKVVMVGAGFVGPYHLAGWGGVPDAQVVAISVRHPDKVRALGREHGVDRLYTSLNEMLDREKPDVLDICTPPAAHAEQVDAAAERRINVICQKPVAPDLASAERVRDTARDAGIRLMVHENFRFRPWYRAAKWALEGGLIGRPFYARSDGRLGGTVTTAAHPEVPWSLARQPSFAGMERLLIVESVIHQIDVCRCLFGEPVSLYAQARRIGSHVQGEDLAALSMRFGDIIALVERSYASRGYPDPPMASELLVVEGERGALFIDREGSVRIEIDVPGERRTLYPEFDRANAYARSYAATIEHFAACLRSGEPFETDIDDNIETLRAALAAYDSWHQDRVVHLGEASKPER